VSDGHIKWQGAERCGLLSGQLLNPWRNLSQWKKWRTDIGEKIPILGSKKKKAKISVANVDGFLYPITSLMLEF
jgi:hypothetical protein